MHRGGAGRQGEAKHFLDVLFFNGLRRKCRILQLVALARNVLTCPTTHRLIRVIARIAFGHSGQSLLRSANARIRLGVEATIVPRPKAPSRIPVLCSGSGFQGTFSEALLLPRNFPEAAIAKQSETVCPDKEHGRDP